MCSAPAGLGGLGAKDALREVQADLVVFDAEEGAPSRRRRWLRRLATPCRGRRLRGVVQEHIFEAARARARPAHDEGCGRFLLQRHAPGCITVISVTPKAAALPGGGACQSPDGPSCRLPSLAA